MWEKLEREALDNLETFDEDVGKRKYDHLDLKRMVGQHGNLEHMKIMVFKTIRIHINLIFISRSDL